MNHRIESCGIRSTGWPKVFGDEGRRRSGSSGLSCCWSACVFPKVCRQQPEQPLPLPRRPRPRPKQQQQPHPLLLPTNRAAVTRLVDARPCHSHPHPILAVVVASPFAKARSSSKGRRCYYLVRIPADGHVDLWPGCLRSR
ncbi:hypothetical protein GALMADRAFT_260313 [Galerina marginata CBS 339.88]|uniref:Uncharacterized protein n=1 Tax=Galerina marginata (strain CBS 339.88) TaxID=685588 RepID=A0A067S2Y7_GALM3|nr:hypothetical protein GALMADRAFT_260313 [Galerina marginata CBS 339.88]